MKLPNKPIEIPRNPNNEEWLKERASYLGASEAGTVVGLNPFESALELWHRKVGIIPSSKPDSLSTWAGKKMEPVIYRDFWCYYDPRDPNPETMVSNGVANRKIRTARKKNFTLVHPEFQWLSCSLDYIIDHNDFHPDGVVDCKNSLQWVTNQYQGGISPHYVVQMSLQMLITGFEYSELAYLLDGRYLTVNPIPAARDLQEKIVAETQKFWQTVEQGRLIWERQDLSESERLQELTALEPEIDSGKALESYLKQRFTAAGKMGKLNGDSEILKFAKDYLKLNEELSAKEADKRLISNMLRKIFLDNQVDEIIFQIPNKNGIVVAHPGISYRTIDGKSTLRVSKELEKVV